MTPCRPTSLLGASCSSRGGNTPPIEDAEYAQAKEDLTREFLVAELKTQAELSATSRKPSTPMPPNQERRSQVRAYSQRRVDQQGVL